MNYIFEMNNASTVCITQKTFIEWVVAVLELCILCDVPFWSQTPNYLKCKLSTYIIYRYIHNHGNSLSLKYTSVSHCLTAVDPVTYIALQLV